MSDKAFFKTTSIVRGKWDYFIMIKESIHQETITIINVCIPVCVCFFFFLDTNQFSDTNCGPTFNSIYSILILTIQTWYKQKS